MASIFGLYAYGRVPAMLNFSTGAVNMAAACTAAQVRTIITSRKFIEAGEMQDDVKLLEKTCKIVYLEDVRETVGALDKLRGLTQRLFTPASLKACGASRDPNSPAVILFTSGSEGVPKGVVLSHRNLNSNKHQILARIALMPNDIFFCALPVFHAFGFLGGVMLPCTTGMKAFLYPSPCITRSCRNWFMIPMRPSCSLPTPSCRAMPAMPTLMTSTACACWWAVPSV